MFHTEEKWCTKRCVSLLVQVSVFAFKLQNILKKPKQYRTRFTEAHYVLEM